jgi:hypothetical protein
VGQQQHQQLSLQPRQQPRQLLRLLQQQEQPRHLLGRCLLLPSLLWCLHLQSLQRWLLQQHLLLQPLLLLLLSRRSL